MRVAWEIGRRLARTLGMALIIVTVVGSVLPSAVVAAPPAQDMLGSSQPSPFLQLFPELKRLPAPKWLQEGQRTTYYIQGATFNPDPEATNTSGASLINNDVVALDAKNAVISTSMYLITDGGVSPSGVFGATALPSVSDYWIHPSVLKNAERVANEELAVVHMPATIANKKYNAVRFEYTSGNTVTVWMFEEVTGLLIYYRHTVGEAGDANHSSNELYLVTQRMLNLPWQGKRAPAWVKRGLELPYDGTRSVVVAGSPSGQMMESASATFLTVQPRWSSAAVSSNVAGIDQGTAQRVTGTRQMTGALWLPAEALTAKVRSPLLDKDPITGIETSYARTGGNVVITEKGPLHLATSTYDGVTGKLIASHLDTQIGLALQSVELELAQ